MASTNTYTINYAASIQVVIRQLRKLNKIQNSQGLSTQRTLLYELPTAKLYYNPDIGCQIDVYNLLTAFEDANKLLITLKLKPTLDYESLLSFYGELTPFSQNSPETPDKSETSS